MRTAEQPSPVDAWRGPPCDVLISEIGLPDGNGWELINRLAHGQNAPFLHEAGLERK